MKILITGAMAVGNVLLKIIPGHGIHYLTTQKRTTQWFTPSKRILLESQNEEIDTACFDGVDLIVHLAGIISQRWTAKNKKEILDSRVEGRAYLLKVWRSVKTSIA